MRSGLRNRLQDVRGHLWNFLFPPDVMKNTKSSSRDFTGSLLVFSSETQGNKLISSTIRIHQSSVQKIRWLPVSLSTAAAALPTSHSPLRSHGPSLLRKHAKGSVLSVSLHLPLPLPRTLSPRQPHGHEVRDLRLSTHVSQAPRPVPGT